MPSNQGASAHQPSAHQLMASLRELERLGAARAALLRDEEREPGRQGLLFLLGSRALLAPVARLVGVRPMPRTLTPVPGSARWVLGLANHRGSLLPLYDLRGLLLADYEGIQRRGFAILVPGRDGVFGVVVDDVAGLRRMRWREAAADQESGPEAMAALVIGRCDQDADSALVVDLARLERLPAFTAGRAARHGASLD